MTETQIISLLVSAMKKAQAHGNVSHLECSDDYGKFWYVALRAGELHEQGADVATELARYIEQDWPS